MSAIELKRDYPLAFAKLIEYFASKMGNQLNLDKVPEEIKKQFSPEMVAGMAVNMVAQRHGLYEFMDEQEIYLGIIGSKNSFQISINRMSPDQTFYTNRVDAEEAGFEECFKILNQKLS